MIFIVYLKRQSALTILQWTVCFPIVDHVIFSRKFFFYSSSNYSFIYMRLFKIWKQEFLRVLSRGLQWKKTAQAKKSNYLM